MSDILKDIVARNRAGERIAIPSICSAQPDVLRASMKWAERLDRPIVIEATSNQVNQDGGYTGKTARDFVADINNFALACGVDRDRITLGGDHIGPQAWRNMPADMAMEKARVLVQSYVEAGFEKIHLDCSEGCLDEPSQLGDQLTAERTADLAFVCERTSVTPSLQYVIGTEVPPPGGARADESGDIPATSPASATNTLATHEEAFIAQGLSDLKARVAGLVVQPGVEFSPMQVHHLPIERDPGLRKVMMTWPSLCLEAHSTDYQYPKVFGRLAEIGFAFQKVGPALTFAYRQALYAIDFALQITNKEVGLSATMERVMTTDPVHWQGHYSNDDRVARHVGLADRIRYYWTHPAAQKAVSDLRERASYQTLADPLLQQVFETKVLDRAESLSGSQFQRLIDAQIEIALDPYDIREKAGSNER